MVQSHPLDLRGTQFALSGASGFIGRHLVTALQTRGANVVMLRRPGSPAMPFSTARTHVFDFSDVRACTASLRRLKPTHVIHLAGFANSDRSVSAISRSLDINLLSGMNFILAAMEAVPDSRIVLAGTLETSSPWKGPVEVGSPYGISKAMLEVLSGGLQQLYCANLVNARIGMVYGPDDPNDHRLVPTVVRALLRGQAPNLSSGTRRCDWIFVDDVGEGLMRAAMLEKVTQPSVDIGSGQLTSIREVTAMIRELVGCDVEPQFNGELDRPNEQERAADIAMTDALLGWKPAVSLPDGLARTVRWHRRLHVDLQPDRRAVTPRTAARVGTLRPRPAV
jgi:nucleoside-diphosphate-sugar epimerase